MFVRVKNAKDATIRGARESYKGFVGGLFVIRTLITSLLAFVLVCRGYEHLWSDVAGGQQ
jgi:hypothetical protein